MTPYSQLEALNSQTLSGDLHAQVPLNQHVI